MKKIVRHWLSVVLALAVLLAGVSAVVAENYTVSSTKLKVGANRVTAEADTATIFAFKPTSVGLYEVSVDEPDAVLNFWYGSSQYVSVPATDATHEPVTVTCTAVGQSLLIGLSGVTSATITITAKEGYVPPVKVSYTTYKNTHKPSTRFTMTKEALTEVDITRTQTVVADSSGIYHLGTVDGPILYVNLRASRFTDLYKLFYPDDVEGEEWPAIDVMRGRYSETKGYDFVDAMYEYANALDGDYYYLTVDISKFYQCYGADQGWFVPRYSPFEEIQQGAFVEQSAWLVNAYYVQPDVALGDANGDGRLNNHDLVRLQRYINEWDVTVVKSAADVNGDGKLNNRDLVALQKMLNQ